MDQKKSWKSFNDWFVILLWLGICGSGLNLVINLFNIARIPAGMTILWPNVIVYAATVLLGILGLFLLVHFAKRSGFWIFLSAMLVYGIYNIFFAEDILPMDRIKPFMSIAYVMLLMLLRNDGKNVYQVIFS